MSHEPDHSWSRFLPESWPVSLPCVEAHRHCGETLMITGAGGSIGSALARAITTAEPEKLILWDVAEDPLAAAKDLCGNVFALPVLGSISNMFLLEHVLRTHHPSVIYHAAAYKQVPFLEQHPFAAIHNNTLATKVLMDAACRHGARVVFLSTDKAAHPHSVMGASKRIAEWIVASQRGTVVRLANVIGTSGSVVPAFLRQLEAAGPFTVTHPEATRWFLSMDQAVSALLSADASERVLLPEFGPPVRIKALADFLIASRGAVVEMHYSGLRPGDKLVEDRLAPGDTFEKSAKGLEMYRTKIPTDLNTILESLELASQRHDLSALLETLCHALPEYVPSDLLRAAACAGVSR